MPCRVGITRDPSTRKAQWEQQVVGLRNWKEEYVGSKLDAQDKEDRQRIFCDDYQKNRGTCHAHPGGGDPDTSGWYVYDFDYDRMK